jgi:hypothetical protein
MLRTRLACLFLAPLAVGACSNDDGRGEAGTEDTSIFGDGDGDGDGTGDGDGDGDGDEGWSAEQEIPLRINDNEPSDLNLHLDKDDVGELLGPVAEEILLIELDSTPLLTNTLNEVKNACGVDWQLDNANPYHDCNLTELGQSFKGPDNTWQTSAEYALVRILTMTPANSQVEGTSIEGIQEIADFVNLGGGFSQILADSLQIERTEEFLTTDVVVESIRENLIATHPNTNSDGSIPITLADALDDLDPISSRLGPVGDHPGVLDPDFPCGSELLTEEFALNVVAQSNLRVLDGIDMSVGKDYMTVIDDRTGPTFDDEAEIDFETEDGLSVEGIADESFVDLRFQIFEHGSYVPACYGDGACPQNAPGNPVGAGTVWNHDTWLLEYLVAYGGTLKYADLEHQQCYGGCWVTEVNIGQDGFPLGWAEFVVLFDIGSPPEDQYVWELINEVAQVQLHETPYGSIAEGDANVEFTVLDVDVGLSGEETIEAVRPYLQDQASEIAGYLLGNYKDNNGPVDIYYRRASDEEPYLFFVAQEDLIEGAEYGWSTPGLFNDPELTDLASSTSIPGVDDQLHHKLPMVMGEHTYYAADDEGGLYRLRIVVPAGDPDEVTVFLAHSVD